MTHREIIKVIYKINLNKTLKINEIINKMLQQLARIIIEHIYFFSTNALKKTFNHRILKKIFMIILRKSNKKINKKIICTRC